MCGFVPLMIHADGLLGQPANLSGFSLFVRRGEPAGPRGLSLACRRKAPGAPKPDVAMGRAVGVGPPQPRRPIPAHLGLHHWRRSLGLAIAPSTCTETAKGAAAALARTDVLVMQAECRNTDRSARLPNQQLANVNTNVSAAGRARPGKRMARGV